jgi:hypothetical protein
LNESIRLPDKATPVPFKTDIYFLDSALLDKKSRVFIPDEQNYKINDKARISVLENKSSYHRHQRIKCALIKDDNYIYMLGGMAGPNKIISNACEKFNPRTERF